MLSRASAVESRTKSGGLWSCFVEALGEHNATPGQHCWPCARAPSLKDRFPVKKVFRDRTLNSNESRKYGLNEFGLRSGDMAANHRKVDQLEIKTNWIGLSVKRMSRSVSRRARSAAGIHAKAKSSPHLKPNQGAFETSNRIRISCRCGNENKTYKRMEGL